MPIANCFLRADIPLPSADIASAWRSTIGVDLKDVSISFIPGCLRQGAAYAVMVQLFLPSLWSPASIKTIQLSLADLLQQSMSLEPEDVFIITTIVQSGAVVEQGAIVEW